MPVLWQNSCIDFGSTNRNVHGASPGQSSLTESLLVPYWTLARKVAGASALKRRIVLA